MSAHIRYAYLKGHTWLFRRNYPVDVALALGAQALKQSLKTSDPGTARVRAAEVNARFETLVEQVRSQAEDALSAPESTADVPQPSAALSGLPGEFHFVFFLRMTLCWPPPRDEQVILGIVLQNRRRTYRQKKEALKLPERSLSKYARKFATRLSSETPTEGYGEQSVRRISIPFP